MVLISRVSINFMA